MARRELVIFFPSAVAMMCAGRWRSEIQPRIRLRKSRGGTILYFLVVLTGVTLSLLALALDTGLLMVQRARLQNAADAAAMAAAQDLHTSLAAARAVAVEFAAANCAGGGEVLREGDIVFGRWDPDRRQFTAGGTNVNAVRVTVERTGSRGNAVPLCFARILGRTSADLRTSALACLPVGRPVLRFLLDPDALSSSVESVVAAAGMQGVSPRNSCRTRMATAFSTCPRDFASRSPRDNSATKASSMSPRMPAQFPFVAGNSYTTLDFLAAGTALEPSLGTADLQALTWLSSDAPLRDFVGRGVLDPAPGVSPVSSAPEVLALANDPDQVHVSPVFGNDLSMLETDPGVYGSPTANLAVARRGLLAFRILAARPHPMGGLRLPLLTIEIVDPDTVPLNQTRVGKTGSGRQPYLVE